VKVFATFLLVMFVLGGTKTGRLPLTRPVALAMVCVVVALTFLSLRVVE
jgi:hypothetical protein